MDEIQLITSEFEEMKAALHEARVKLEIGSKELLDKNKDLENAKRATLNLLEDLEEEKIGVEKKITERTRELKEAQATLVASVNSLPRGMMIVDTHRNLLMVNSALGKILELSGSPDSWTVADIEKKFEGILDIMGQCATCEKEKRNIALKEIAFGKKFLDVELTPIIMLKDSNEVLGSTILIGDITEAKLLEHSREEFFAIASHEMRTPLTAIRGNMSLIKDFFGAKLKNPEVKEMIDDSYHASVRLIGIVNDFLDASRLEQGKISLKKETVDLAVLVAEVLRELNALADSKKLKLEFKTKITDSLPPVSADRDRAKQVIYNLLSNALNYTQKGGVAIEMAQEDNFLKVSVSDTGKGISLQNQNLLFRKFQQAGETILARDITKSTGLGLYISKLLVEAMGGKIWLEHSEPDKGSVFAFTLPIVA